jgi:hypothetical protein
MHLRMYVNLHPKNAQQGMDEQGINLPVLSRVAATRLTDSLHPPPVCTVLYLCCRLARMSAS